MTRPDFRPRLRAAAPSDAGAIKRCVDAAYQRYVPRMGKPPGPMLDDFPEVIRRHAVFVAQSGGKVIGVLVLIRTQGGMLLDNIAVHPAHQGRCAGRRLLAHAESETRKRGSASLQLYTHECMTENVAIYKRAGYFETGRRTERGYKRVYMRKSLAALA